MTIARKYGISALLLALTFVGNIAQPLQSRGADSYTENPGPAGDGHFVVGPEYKLHADLTDHGNPAGKLFEFKMKLADSKIFRGDDKTLEPEKKKVRTERKIQVYIPAAYKDGTAAPLLVIHDGPGQMNLVRHALDNLTVSKDPNRRLPAFIAVAVENGGNDGKKQPARTRIRHDVRSPRSLHQRRGHPRRSGQR